MTVEQAALADKISTAAEAYIERLTVGDAGRIVELFADGATVEDPSAPTCAPPANNFWSSTRSSQAVPTPPGHPQVEDTAVFEFTLVTHTAGMAFEITPVDIMVFDAEGKIVSMRAVWAQEDLKAVLRLR